MCAHAAPGCPGLTAPLRPSSALSVSDKWGLIILNSAHLRWCVCNMTERRVRTLSDVSVIDSFSFHRSLDSYLWCSRDQRKAYFQQHIRSHASSPAERNAERILVKQEVCLQKNPLNWVWELIYMRANIKKNKNDSLYSISKGVHLALWGWQKTGRVTAGFLGIWSSVQHNALTAGPDGHVPDWGDILHYREETIHLQPVHIMLLFSGISKRYTSWKFFFSSAFL